MRSNGTTVKWLSAEEQRSWRAFVLGTTLLLDRLDRDLAEHGLSLAEYEILVRLSEREGRRMRMAVLADALSHSRSRVTHTISRMETAGLVARRPCDGDGRGIEAVMTDKGYEVLEAAAPVHVRGVRANLVDLCSNEDFAALGRVLNATVDKLIDSNPAADIR